MRTVQSLAVDSVSACAFKADIESVIIGATAADKKLLYEFFEKPTRATFVRIFLCEARP